MLVRMPVLDSRWIHGVSWLNARVSMAMKSVALPSLLPIIVFDFVSVGFGVGVSRFPSLVSGWGPGNSIRMEERLISMMCLEVK